MKTEISKCCGNCKHIETLKQSKEGDRLNEPCYACFLALIDSGKRHSKFEEGS